MKRPEPEQNNLNTGSMWRLTLAAWFAILAGSIAFAIVYASTEGHGTIAALVVGSITAIGLYLHVGHPLRLLRPPDSRFQVAQSERDHLSRAGIRKVAVRAETEQLSKQMDKNGK